MVVSVWSKDYDSDGGKKRFCLYMYNTQKKQKKKNFNSANAGPKPGEKGGGLCILHVKILL